jgi:hypothetical protein
MLESKARICRDSNYLFANEVQGAPNEGGLNVSEIAVNLIIPKGNEIHGEQPGYFYQRFGSTGVQSVI